MTANKKIIVFVAFFLFFIAFFYKVFLLHLVPFPSGLLVTFFFPYNSGGWFGAHDFITSKEFISGDVVRQLFPWRDLAFDLIRQGSLPLWNSYSFSGTPLIANLQSAVFYPVNILFLFFNSKIAWMAYILSQPILAFSFMYLFIRQINLSRFSAVFAGLAFSFIGYFIVWFELGIVGHSGLWLPLILFGLNAFYQKKKSIYLVITTLGVAFSCLGGHAQTTVYVLLTSSTYAVFLLINQKKDIRTNLLLLLPFILGIGISAVQLLPTLELYSLSPRLQNYLDVYHNFQLPTQNIVTIFAPDFFGNPGAGNYWGKNYGEFFAYAGIVAIIFSIVGLFHHFKNLHVRFFCGLFLLSLLLALPTPVSNLIPVLHVPVLDSGLPARALFLSQFSIVILAAFGIEAYINKKVKLRSFVVLGLVYLVLWVILIFGGNVFGEANREIAKRNLILPSLVFLVVFGISFMSRKFSTKFIYLGFILIFFTAAFEYQYEMYKYLPFSKLEYIFPNQALVDYLKQKPSYQRFYGYEAGRIDSNLQTYFRLPSVEGYDPLYIGRYGAFISYTQTGSLQAVPRSDAQLKVSAPDKDSYAKEVALAVTGVKYIFDRDDSESREINGQSSRFKSDRFDFLWQDGKYKVFENKNIIPRASVFYNFEIITEDNATLQRLFSKSFDFKNSLILKENFGQNKNQQKSNTAEILSYKPNEVRVKANAKSPGLLFLSDNFYPGWNAYVDGRKTKIYLADYTFRAVPLGQGIHVVTFKYEPLSFKIGAIISAVSFGVTFLLLLVFRRKYAR